MSVDEPDEYIIEATLTLTGTIKKKPRPTPPVEPPIEPPVVVEPPIEPPVVVEPPVEPPVVVEPPEPEAPIFVVGEDYPDEFTVGAGIIRPYPTSRVNVLTTFTGTPTNVVKDIIFNDLVVILSDGWVFENCAFRGPAIRTTGANLVDVSPKVKVPPVFKYCDINPQTPSPHWNGIGYKNYRLEQCHVWGCTDNFAAFALKDDPDPAVHVQILGTWAEKLAQKKPDISRDVTHNDLIQLQGNVGPADDILIDGCRFDAYHSPDQSSPLPPEHTQISAIMLSPSASCQNQVNLTVKRSWLSGGIFTLNAAAGTLANSTLVLIDNEWEKPRKGGPAAAIAIDVTLTKRTLENNYYTDGTLVPVYNA